MNLTAYLFSLLFALLSITSGGQADRSQPVEAANDYALTNARIVTVTNGIIENGTVLISEDRIVAVGTDVDIPAGTTVIDCTGLSIYPGMIDSGTQLGTVEVSSDARTRDFSEIGDLTPHAQALTAVNPNSVLIPVTRVSGVTTVLTEPQGGLLPGTAAMIHLHGYTPDQMFVEGTKVVKMNFPASGRRGRFDTRSDEDVEKASKKSMAKLNKLWDAAQEYARIDSAHAANPSSDQTPEYVPEISALVPVVRNEQILMISTNRAADILAALKWVEERGFERVVLSGVSEGWRVADKISESGLPALVGPVLSIPTRQSDRYDKAYANAGLLLKAGVKVAIRSGQSENVRNLPYNAGFAAAYGMGKEAALRAVTIEPAEIFGVSDKLGSIEVGKQANLFVSTGDPFETSTQIRDVFIRGYRISMDSRHTRLYEEFLNRDPGLTN